MTDIFTKEKRSEIMSKIKAKGSKIECKMSIALEQKSFDFIYQPTIFGRPDFIVQPNIAIFCDSSFWHGRDWPKLKKKLPKEYWREHISKNRKRDAIVTKALTAQGYIVLRFWDSEINKDIDGCLKRVLEAGGKIKNS